MSFWTSFSSNLRPIRRLIAYSVFLGLVTAWRLAEAPTKTSPSSWYATIDGVVRAPSEFSITRVVLPSMIDTHELVVPRSMPMIFAMFLLLKFGKICCYELVDNPVRFKGRRGDFLWESCGAVPIYFGAATVTSAGRSTRSLIV
ncbi:hypothetical protein D3C87_822160 [compost metagenome]